ncbi:GGDEF domain-containing protein [Pseudoxanthomonas yeongjuensis]|uniref:GGDEF domain-containing protein n=1 Tax=Pseudoxanthomonas yeongjuensis TaxID=377616 RepID=UPI001FE4428E|nr:GGDEF domain-containing protein [Pseudoxanthomonas yeongjuensis]KAF1717387.1 GGDEF domain-containing protein [Pseudoxanthomonas yeongjuensis]
MLNRFRRNSQLGILALLGTATTCTLAMFAGYRALHGQWPAAIIDFAIVVLIGVPVIHALRTGNTAGPGAFLCATNSLSCAIACYVIGPVSLPWVYLVLMTNFLIAGPRQALAFNLLLTVALLLMPRMLDLPVERMSAAAVAALVTLFAWLSALRVSTDHQQLEVLASLDALTGLPNRRMMEQALEGAVARHRAGDRSHGLLIVDIDHFKEVNDTHGHAAGDAAIADLAAILKFEMRKHDRVFRFGGEEFVVLLDVDTRDDLWTASERLRQAVRNGLRGPGGRITISLGGAMAGEEERWQEWFSLADEALYRAKNNGRDSTVVMGGAVPTDPAPEPRGKPALPRV